MTHKEFERYLTKLFNNFYYGEEIVVFAKHKYTYEKEYENFEIIISKNDNEMEIDWDYHEGEHEYLIDGWFYLSDLLSKVHKQENIPYYGGKNEN